MSNPITRLNVALGGALALAVAMSIQVTHVQQAVSQQQANHDADATSLDDLILFDSRTQGGSENVFLVRPDGSGLRQLTSAVEGSSLSRARFASWSSDRSQVLFQGYDDEDNRGDIYVIDVDGSNLRRLNSGMTLTQGYGSEVVFSHLIPYLNTQVPMLRFGLMARGESDFTGNPAGLLRSLEFENLAQNRLMGIRFTLLAADDMDARIASIRQMLRGELAN